MNNYHDIVPNHNFKILLSTSENSPCNFYVLTLIWHDSPSNFYVLTFSLHDSTCFLWLYKSALLVCMIHQVIFMALQKCTS